MTTGPQPRVITSGGSEYRLTFERRIVGGQRDLIATAYDDDGNARAVKQVTTASARAFLHRDPAYDPPSWDDLEDVAAALLELDLEEESG